MKRCALRLAGMTAFALLLLPGCEEAAPPGLSGVVPSSVVEGVEAQLELQGSFEPVLRASYRAGGRSEILVSFRAFLDQRELAEVRWIDRQRLAATAPADLAVGTYALRVRGPDGLEAGLDHAFSVRPRLADAGTAEGGTPDVTRADLDPSDTALPDLSPSDTAPLDSGLPLDWYDPSWRCRARVGFDTTALASDDLVDFPALVKLDASWPGYARASNDGRELRFVDSSGQLLPHEIEAWSPGGTSVVWVGVPFIGHATTTQHLHVYFDNGAASDAQAPAQVFQNAYAAVLHLNQDLQDSTANQNHGTNSGSTQTSGYLAGGRAFVHDQQQEIAIGDTNIPLGNSARSICAWTSTPTLNPVSKYWFISYGEFSGNGGFFIGRVGDQLWCGGIGDDIIADSVFSVDTWGYHCCVVSATSGVRLYSDGVVVQGPQVHDLWGVAPGEVLIGGHINPGAAESWDGALDEVRISSVDRSADWLLAEFLSMTGALFDLGAPECLD